MGYRGTNFITRFTLLQIVLLRHPFGPTQMPVWECGGEEEWRIRGRNFITGAPFEVYWGAYFISKGVPILLLECLLRCTGMANSITEAHFGWDRF